MFFQLFHGSLQKAGVGRVVAFGDPDVAAAGEPDSLFPLEKGASAVAGVQDGVADGGMAAVFEQDVRAVVRGAVVQEDEFEIGECLRQD